MFLVEKRLIEINTTTEKYLQNRLDAALQDKESIANQHEIVLTQLKRKHEMELNELRELQSNNIEIVKDDHSPVAMDKIPETKLEELNASKDSIPDKSILEETSSSLERITTNLQDLQMNIYNKIESMLNEREKKLDERENRIQELEICSKTNQESNMREKENLMKLVNSLEMEMNKIRKESSDENRELRKKLAAFESEKMAFEKEKELFHEQTMIRSEESINDLKENKLLELQQIQLEIEEGKNSLTTQRAQLNLEKLQYRNDSDLERKRIELENAIQDAKEATKKAECEKQNYSHMLQRVEEQKRKLEEKEQTIFLLESKIRQEKLLYRVATMNLQDEERKYKIAEKNYQQKIDEIYQKKIQLDEREIQLTGEHLSLTQDRIALENLRHQNFVEQNKEIFESIENRKRYCNDYSNAIANQLQHQQQKKKQREQKRFQYLLEDCNEAVNAAIACVTKSNDTFVLRSHTDLNVPLDRIRFDLNNNCITSDTNNQLLPAACAANNPVEQLLDENIATPLNRMISEEWHFHVDDICNSETLVNNKPSTHTFIISTFDDNELVDNNEKS